MTSGVHRCMGPIPRPFTFQDTHHDVGDLLVVEQSSPNRVAACFVVAWMSDAGCRERCVDSALVPGQSGKYREVQDLKCLGDF